MTRPLDNPRGFKHVLLSHIPPDWWSSPEPLTARRRFIDRMLEELMAKEKAFRDLTEDDAGYFDLVDEYILFQAGTLPTIDILSTLVQDRKAKWYFEPTGPKKLARLGQREELAAQRLQGWKHARHPITDPGWYKYSKAAKSELKLLLRMLRNTANVLPAENLLQRISSLVTPAESQFPELRLSLDALLGYLTEDPHSYRALLERGSKITATSLFEGWVAWQTRYTTRDVRNMISALGSRD